jgi:ribosomal protein S18 acetylase RimI-like enzyme
MELDNPIWHALRGAQQVLGEALGSAARFNAEVSPFGGFAEPPSAADWAQMGTLTGPRGRVAVISIEDGVGAPSKGWSESWSGPGLQMVGSETGVARMGSPPREMPGDDVVPLGRADVEDMMALVAKSRPGPFVSRTVDFGGYVGIRRDGHLVAMAGERLRPPGYAEISAVTTHPDHRRQGLGELLIGVVASGIRSRAETPFLHVAADNANAIELYEALGFATRRTVWFTALEFQAL